MKGIKGINLIGLFDTMVDLFNKPRTAVPWRIKAKKKDELLKPAKATAAKKKHRKAVQASRRRNRS